MVSTVPSKQATRDAISGLLGQVRDAKRLDNVRDAIAGYQADVNTATEANASVLYGLPIEDVTAALAAANEAIEAGDLDAASDALDPVKKARRTETRNARLLQRYEGKVERFNEQVAAAVEAGDETYRGVAIAEVQAIADAATAAIDAGDLDGVRQAFTDLRDAQRTARDLARVRSGIDRLQAAVDAAEEAGEDSIGEATVEEVNAAIAAATEAVAAGDLDAAKEAINSVNTRPPRGEHRHGRGNFRGFRGWVRRW